MPLQVPRTSIAEETSAGFMKVSPEIVRPFPKSGPRKSGGRKHGKRRFLTDTTED